jgi:murein DD-endopeptidase MepM/ murein hydrolase activator NlpD
MRQIDLSPFGERLVLLNRLADAGFAAWDFLPGMRFGERAAWWRGGADRGSAHEGLDISRYRTGDGRLANLGAGARVPVICPGEVVAIVEDFLGRSVFVAHERLDCEGWRLHTIYGHLDPRPGIAVGDQLSAGDEIGTIADPSGRKTAVPPHLHLSVALIAPEGGPERLDWDALRDRSRVRLLDPLPIICGTMPAL